MAVSGGTLVSFGGFAAQAPLAADSNGQFTVTFPGFPPPTFELVFQTVFLDGTAPRGIAFTNAVLAQFGQ